MLRRPYPAVRPARRIRVGALALAASVLVGCGADPSNPAPDPTPAESGEPAPAVSPRAQLAALAAAAADRRFSAHYTLSVPGRPDRTVAVTLATDGSWRVDVPEGAPGGTDVAIAQTADGLFQCSLSWTDWPVGPSCFRVADPGGRLPEAADPRVQHLFTDWVRVLSNQQAPLAVSVGQRLPNVGGTCFAVESTSASQNPPLEVGIYCYDADGTLTGARVAFGTLVLAGAPQAAPPSVTLPGPVVTEPLETASPVPPHASPGTQPTG